MMRLIGPLDLALDCLEPLRTLLIRFPLFLVIQLVVTFLCS